jgi:hypothetical protein
VIESILDASTPSPSASCIRRCVLAGRLADRLDDIGSNRDVRLWRIDRRRCGPCTQILSRRTVVHRTRQGASALRHDARLLCGLALNSYQARLRPARKASRPKLTQRCPAIFDRARSAKVFRAHRRCGRSRRLFVSAVVGGIALPEVSFSTTSASLPRRPRSPK